MKPGDFVTSDTHFGHKALLQPDTGGRLFNSVEEHDEALIRAWNHKVPKRGAIVYHLGDFSFHKPEKTREILRRLNGTKRLVKGNHDKNNGVKKFADLFEWVRDYYECRNASDKKVVMSHYPMITWNQSHYGSWMLHGHSHGNLQRPESRVIEELWVSGFKKAADAMLAAFADIPRRLDVGVDLHPRMEPFSYEEIIERMQGRTHVAVDHHAERTKK